MKDSNWPSKTMVYRLRSHYTLCSLPHEVLLHLFKFLPLRDLLNTRQVCTQFKCLIDSAPHLWSTATFVDEWPNSVNIKHFKRAASADNVEALIKLGIACLYNEGYPESFDDDTRVKGQHAADYLCRAEGLLSGNEPFLWALIRPPWSRNGSCCKATVFRLLKELADNTQECDKTVLYCIARITSLQQSDGEAGVDVAGEVQGWLSRAARAGSQQAMLELWRCERRHCQDTAAKLDRIRQLREITASQDSRLAKMELLGFYAEGNFGGLPEHQAAEATRAFIRASTAMDSQNLLNVQSKLSNAMRYILVDWLVEVAGMKGYSSHTLHRVVSCIDRYLMHQPISKGNLQLVGIAAMVICSRLLETDIITIREAAWLTDGTYQYEKVVRMMGDILATLHGKIDVPSVWEYLMLYCKLAGADRRLQYLALYISELTLLHLDFGRYSLAHQAAGIFYLARIVAGQDCPWPAKLADYTGYQPRDLAPCTLHIHEKCFSEEPLQDHRNVKLAAVRQRYEEEPYLEVGKTEVLDHAALKAQLCLGAGADADHDAASPRHQHRHYPAREGRLRPLPGTPTSCGRVEQFLMSPSRSSRANRHQEEHKRKQREDLVTTPTGELSAASGHETSYREGGNDSFVSLESGYDADMESDAEGEMVVESALSGDIEWEVSPLSSAPVVLGCCLPGSMECLPMVAPTRPDVSSPRRRFSLPVSSLARLQGSADLAPGRRQASGPSTSGAHAHGCWRGVARRQSDDSGGGGGATAGAPYAGQSFRFDTSGKLRPRTSPRQPLKRLENGRCGRRKSKRQYAGPGEAGDRQPRGENSQLLM